MQIFSANPYSPDTIATTKSSSITEIATIRSASGVLYKDPLLPCPPDNLDPYATNGTASEGNSFGICYNAKDCFNIGWAADKSRRLESVNINDLFVEN